MDESILLRLVGAIVGFLILQWLWSIAFKIGGRAYRAMPTGKAAEIAHRVLMWILAIGFVVMVVGSCVGGMLGDAPHEFDEPAYRGRR